MNGTQNSGSLGLLALTIALGAAACLPAVDDGGGGGGSDGGGPPATCGNQRQDGDETDLDCGGSCDPCAVGKVCSLGPDCRSTSCSGGLCQAPASCSDGQLNGQETDLDCGGSCGGCATGKACLAHPDCLTETCIGGSCRDPSCTDAVKNGGETDVDCGGSACGACSEGFHCAADRDCQTGSCDGTSWVCVVPPASCSDHEWNGDETDIDCGGSCSGCGTNQKCSVPTDCLSLTCTNAVCRDPTCSDLVKNQDETDVDCGGQVCSSCQDGEACQAASDCRATQCQAGLCISCSDGLKNGSESDIDCGGSRCSSCQDGRSCSSSVDCQSSDCRAGRCISCYDGINNGSESDVDCGGSCGSCVDGAGCGGAADCQSNRCSSGVCSSCSDGLKNGSETDVDCGGACGACADGKNCLLPADCQSGACQSVCLGWHMSTVVTLPTYSGTELSLAIDSTGNSHLGFRDSRSGGPGVRYALRSAGAWSFTDVTNVASTGRFLSLALTSTDAPEIACRRVYNSSDRVLVSRRISASSWSGSDTDLLLGGRGGVDYAIAGDGTRLVVYRDIFNKRNILEHRSGTSGTWFRVSFLGNYRAGNPAITADSSGAMYLVENVHDATTYSTTTLSYVKWSAASGAASPETIDAAGNPGGRYDVALDSQGRPHVSYYNSVSGDLMHAWRSSGGVWQTETVASSGNVGLSSSIAIDASGIIYIAYDGSWEMKIAKKSTGGTWNFATLGTKGSVPSMGTQVSLALDPTGSPQVVYFNGSTEEIRFFVFGP